MAGLRGPPILHLIWSISNFPNKVIKSKSNSISSFAVVRVPLERFSFIPMSRVGIQSSQDKQFFRGKARIQDEFSCMSQHCVKHWLPTATGTRSNVRYQAAFDMLEGVSTGLKSIWVIHWQINRIHCGTNAHIRQVFDLGALYNVSDKLNKYFLILNRFVKKTLPI